LLAPLQRPRDFERTLRALAADRDRGALLLAAASAVLLVLWGIWLLVARVPVLVVTAEARLQVALEAHLLAAPMAGQVREVHVVAGQRVAGGQVLYRLDGRVAEGEAAETSVRAEGLRAQVAATGEERESLLAQLRQTEDVASARLAEAAARAGASRAAADSAVREAERFERLLADGLSSVSEVDRLRAEAARHSAEAEAAARALDRLRAEAAAERHELRNDLANLGVALSRLTAELGSVVEQGVVRTAEAERYVVRAPFAGRVGDVAVRQRGVVVGVGEALATLVPEDELRAVAYFAPGEALGRVRPGQPAELRLEAFPWTEYGSLAARVVAVEEATVEEQVRVDLELVDGSRFPAPLTHGLRASALVEVERRSPLHLLVRGLGRLASPSASPPASE
jgi:multidrug resistance efflux pump